jgi:hypothetical protein
LALNLSGEEVMHYEDWAKVEDILYKYYVTGEPLTKEEYDLKHRAIVEDYKRCSTIRSGLKWRLKKELDARESAENAH